MTFTRYANITDDQKEEILKELETYKQISGVSGTVGHAAACIASRVFELTTSQWNSKIGADAFAATLAVLAMNGEVNLELVK